MRKLEQAAIYCAPAVFVVLWSTGFIGGKYGLPYAEPFTYLSLRMLLAVVLLGVIILATRPVWPEPRSIINSAIIGLLMQGLYLGGVFTAIWRGLSPALVALIVCLQPVVTSTVAGKILGERVILRQWIGLILGLAGVFLVVRGNIGSVEAPLLAWIACFIALAGITAGTIYQKRVGGSVDWRAGLFIQNVVAGAVFYAIALMFETRVVDWNIHFIGALAWMVLVLSIGSIWLLYFLIRRSAATQVTSLFYLVPAVTAIQAWLIFGDRLDVYALLGMAACAGGVFLVNQRASA
jgi:drug/metabolite transporter (DMT)-like permease